MVGTHPTCALVGGSNDSMESEHGAVPGKGPSSIVVAEKDEELRLKTPARLFREGFEVAQGWDSVSLSDAITREGACLLDLELPEDDARRDSLRKKGRTSSRNREGSADEVSGRSSYRNRVR